QSANAGGLNDIFVTKFGPSGTIQYSTYVGGRGNDQSYGIAVDSAAAAYVAGYSTSANLANGQRLENSFPLSNAFQADFGGGSDDANLFKVAPAGNALTYSTWLGGSGSENATRVAVNNNGMACITGYTTTDDSAALTPFPLVNPIQFVLGGGYEAFISCFASDGKSLVSSTYYGGEGNDS